MTAPAPAPRTVYSVGELTQHVKQLLESHFGWVWLEGEISNLSRPASGHLYFTLKDTHAQIRAAFFRGRQRDLAQPPRDGQKVRVYGQLTVYERSGQYQLIVQRLENAGQGDLQAAFEALKQKLDAEGLFRPDRKRTLPLLPRCIGIVTSPTGAAIRDILNVLTRRFPNRRIVIAPVRVQGEGAAQEISAAIRAFNEWNQADVLIVGRGGGSLEDLWSFNEEVVARAIAASRIPVISAVGHEIDFAISDFVADLRAPTPSAAAELVIGRKEDFEASLRHFAHRLRTALDTSRTHLKSRYELCRRSGVFREPAHLVQHYRQRLHTHRRDLAQWLRSSVRERQQRVDEADLRMRHRVQSAHQQARNRFSRLEAQLRLLGPHAVLARGYSITRNAHGDIIKEADTLKPGDPLTTLLAHGSVTSVVQKNPLTKEQPHDPTP